MSNLLEEKRTEPIAKLPAIRAVALYTALTVGCVAGFSLINTVGGGLAEPIPELRVESDTRANPDALAHVLIALIAVLVTGRILGMVLRFVGQPPVIGEVVGGIVLGPSALGLVWPEATAFILPSSVRPYLGVIAQFGVILYMFLVGLELNTEGVGRSAQAILGISHASIAVPFLMGAGLALVLYPDYSSGKVSFTSFSLFIGVAMSITAFPVLARILTDLRMQKTSLGILALGSAAAGDVAAWCLLAFAVGVAQARLGGAILVLCLTAAYITFMFGVVRPVVLRLVQKYDRADLPPTAVAGIFAALLLSALITEMIGIHAIFGAFLLGAVFPHHSQITASLTRGLEGFVTILLLPAFFAFVGMRTEIGLVSGIQQWLLCGLIIVVATVGKVGGTMGAARLAGLTWRDAGTLGALMNTRGLMELIVLTIGLDLGVISPALFTMMVLMAIVTTVTTAPVVKWLYAPRAAGQVEKAV